MTLQVLEVRDFRNIAQARLDASAGINLIFGANAAGKTSVLEAIYHLGRARSFRTGNPRELIRSGCPHLQVYGSVMGECGYVQPVGVQRSSRDLTLRIAGEAARGLAELARAVPVLLLNSHTHGLVDAGPQQRRRFLDWGVFQMEPEFLPLWRRYRRALSNRNAALRQGQSNALISAWTAELMDVGERIDALRSRFVSVLGEVLEPLASQLLPEQIIKLGYRRGWSQTDPLGVALEAALSQDRRVGYTRHGPHAADLGIQCDGVRAASRVSRGQQKALVAALVCAQASLYRRHRGRDCVLLVDDLPAELDGERRARLTRALVELPVQIFVTSIEQRDVGIEGWTDPGVFEIDAGKVRKVVY
jgi:DNA replication and repair protein RecF